jgi:hypothetical protein
MIKFVATIITFCLMIGVGDSLVRMTYAMATGAKNAFLHDQLSYSAFTKALINAKPRKPADHSD